MLWAFTTKGKVMEKKSEINKKKKEKAKIQNPETKTEPEKKIEEGTREKELPKTKKIQKPRVGKAHKRSKRYGSAAGHIDKNRHYVIEEAIELAKKTANTKFVGSVEVHIRLGIDSKKGEQQIRGAIALPHGTGKSVKIAAFVSEGREEEAKSAGADIAGSAELISRIKQTGKIDFEVAVAAPEMMPKLAVIAKILGPKGLMPSPKNETITTNLKKTIEELKKGKINFKNDDTGNVHATIGKTSFESKKLLENYQALFTAIKRAKPASSKGTYIQSITLHATMGPGIRVIPN